MISISPTVATCLQEKDSMRKDTDREFPGSINWILGSCKIFYVKTSGGQRHNLQFSMDIFNVGNLIAGNTRNFGYVETTTITNPLRVQKNVVNNAPTYTWSEYQRKLVTDPFQVSNSVSNLWYMQLGVRYTF